MIFIGSKINFWFQFKVLLSCRNNRNVPKFLSQTFLLRMSWDKWLTWSFGMYYPARHFRHTSFQCKDIVLYLNILFFLKTDINNLHWNKNITDSLPLCCYTFRSCIASLILYLWFQSAAILVLKIGRIFIFFKNTLI